jgi:beta-glucanase (GH16 family)
VLIVFLVVPVRAQQSIFTTQAPQNPVDTDNAAGEYGMVFASSVPGQITGVRYWKSSSDTGTHTGRLWRVSDRALLATVTFSGGSSTGWQTQSFPSPVTISANTQYLVTVSTPRYYGFTQAGLASTITNGPLSTMVGGNGLYGLTLGAYPTLSWNNSNYFRDVVFVASPPAPTPAITISPKNISINYGSIQQFTAALSGGATGPVAWSATCGTVSSSGLYTAPQGGTSCSVIASVTGASDSAEVTLIPPGINVTPDTVTLTYAGTQQFNASLSGGATPPVSWTATCGAVDDTGFYTAPDSGTSCTVMASAGGASDTSTVSLTPPGTPGINVTPDEVTLTYGDAQQFNASLSGGATGPVSWSATCGSINSSGYYTAPQSGTSCTVTGSASGASDTSTVSLAPGPGITVTPDTVTLTYGGTQEFTAELTGSATGPVSWSATCGSIDNSGYYTAPQSGTSCTVTGQVTGANDQAVVTLSQPPPPVATTLYYQDFHDPEWWVENRTSDTTNNEIACYRPEQVSMTNGLVITAIYQTNTCSSGLSPSQQWPYTSGMIQWNARTWLYGTLEFRAKFPRDGGVWPSLWMLGQQCQEYWKAYLNAPSCAGSPEIDVVEIFSGSSSVNQQLHYDGHHDQCSPVVDVRQYHTYQFIWQPGSMIWKIDGNTTCTVTGNYVPSTPMFLIINMAIGGIGGGTPNPNSFPQSMTMDYVKITP